MFPSGQTKVNSASSTAASKQNFWNNVGVCTDSCVQGCLPTPFCDRGRCERHPRRSSRPRTAIHHRHRRRKSWESPRVEAWCCPPAQELRLQGAKSHLVRALQDPLLKFPWVALVRIRLTVLRSAWRVRPSTLEACYLLLMVENISR